MVLELRVRRRKSCKCFLVARGAWRVARAELWAAVGLRRGAGLKARAGRTPAGSTTC